MNILILDDDYLVLQVMGRMLKRLGHEPYTFDDEFEALEYLSSDKAIIDMVFLDMNLKYTTGSELYFKIKELQPKIKVIGISGLGYNQKIQELLNNGMCEFIQKPFDLNDIQHALSKLC